MDESESKLDAAFALLQRTNFTIKDDTCLEKLYLYISKQWDMNDSSATSLKNSDKNGLLELIVTVTSSPDNFDHAVVSLCVKLCGIPGLAAQYSDAVLTSLMTIYSHQVIKNLTVAVSFYCTLTNLVPCHLGKLMEVLPWRAIEHHALQSLREEKSIYLTKEVSRFLISYLKVSSEIHSPSIHDIVKNIATAVKSCVKSTKGCQCSRAESRLINLYVNVMAPCLDVFVMVCGKEEMTNQMLMLLRCCPLDLVPVIVECLLKLLHGDDASEQNKDLQLQTLIWDIADDDLIKAQKAAIIVLSNSSLHGDVTAYEDLFRYPIQVVAGVEDSGTRMAVYPLQVECRREEASSRITAGILRQMGTKSTCINIICQSLQGITSIKEKVEKFEDLILRLFQSVVLDSPMARAKYNAYVFRNRKVLLKCLDILVQDTEMLQCEPALKCLETLMKSHDNHLIFSKSLDCMKCCFPVMLIQKSDHSQSLQSLMVSMTTCIQLQLCSMQWEVRDSSLNFIRHILINHSDSPEISSWIRDHKFLLYIYQGLSDSESYVRASAISCLSSVLKDNIYREAMFKEVDINMDAILDKIIEMITDEAEAFPRRAATILVLECWDTFQQHALQSRIYSVFSSLIPNDFDWEVKLGAVQFWDQCIFRFVNSFTNSERTPEVKECASQGDVDSIMKHTDNVKILGLKTLLKLSEDHDDSVVEKSLESLLQIRRTLQGNAIALNQFWKLSSEENQNILAQFESRNLSSELELLQNSKDERTEYLCLLDDILSYCDENKTEEDVALDCY